MESLIVASDLGDAEAQFELGVLYFHGRSVERDTDKALALYRKSAAQNHVISQNNIGWMHEIGAGVAVDYSEAEKWYRRAAEQGYAIAQRNLSQIYVMKSRMWMEVARRNGFEPEPSMRTDRIGPMRSVDRRAVSKMADRCIASKFKDC